MIRTYPLKHAINKRKQKKILEIVEVYHKLACDIASRQWQEFYRHGDFNRDIDIKDLDTLLSERYKQTCQYQVVGVLNSFLANRQNDFVDIVYPAHLSEQTKKELFYLNKYQLWFSTSEVTMVWKEKGETQEVKISLETIRLSRTIFKHVLKQHRRPCLKRCNMALDNKVARVRPKEEEGAKTFDYWIELSTLQFRKTIQLPLVSNRYFEEKMGENKKFCQINLNQEKQIKICLIKDVEKRPYLPENPKIGLDFGLQNLFASDSGDLSGHTFLAILKKYDGYFSSLAQNRQRQNLPVKSESYNNLVGNVRNFLKNEINRVINQIVERYKPKEIVVEKLDFTAPDLSRRLNRILSNSGKKIIKAKFDSINEEFGIIITYVPAPYTSQTCHLCG